MLAETGTRTPEVTVKRRTVPFKSGRPIFNLFSLHIGTFDSVWTPQTRLGEYATALAIVEVTMTGDRVRRVRWRLDNCRRYTPRALLARRSFLVLSRILDVSPQRLRPRVKLTRYGFTRSRRREFVERLRRSCGISIPVRTLALGSTASQVVATVLAATRPTR